MSDAVKREGETICVMGNRLSIQAAEDIAAQIMVHVRHYRLAQALEAGSTETLCYHGYVAQRCLRCAVEQEEAQRYPDP